MKKTKAIDCYIDILHDRAAVVARGEELARQLLRAAAAEVIAGTASSSLEDAYQKLRAFKIERGTCPVDLLETPAQRAA